MNGCRMQEVDGTCDVSKQSTFHREKHAYRTTIWGWRKCLSDSYSSSVQGADRNNIVGRENG